MTECPNLDPQKVAIPVLQNCSYPIFNRSFAQKGYCQWCAAKLKNSIWTGISCPRCGKLYYT